MLTVDQFLSRYFRASERRASPKSVSVETRVDCGATLEQAQHAEETYAWGLLVMGRAKLAPQVHQVLEWYYLNLSQAHQSIVERRFGGEISHVEVRLICAGDAPDEAADLESYTDWRALAAGCGIRPDGRRSAASVAMGIWREGRAAVQEELERRGAIE